jgi:hypothetical protein
MEIGRKFNELVLKEYFLIIDNHKDYTDFNRLGLYRSICENENLELKDRIEVRDYANKFFAKTFQFYQLKDPKTFFDLTTLGRELTVADERKIWEDIRGNQEKILSKKKIKHRNFGEYSKHNCGYENCPYNGLMIKQGSRLAESVMHFKTDKNEDSKKLKSNKAKKLRRNKHRLDSGSFEN